MSTGQSPGYHTSEDEQILHKLGYAQELFRGMGGFRNFAISFTIISILAGCLTSYTIAFEHGGPVAVTWGWLLVGLMSTLIALSMAEIASAYPTAGGLYYWASKLGSPGWGWATGWFNLIGQIAVTAAIGYGLAVFGQVLFDYWFNYSAHMDDWFGASFNMSTYIAVRGLHARGGAHQHVQHPDHVGAEHDLGVVAHGRRRRGRRHPHHRPGSAPVPVVRLHRDREQLRATAAAPPRSPTRPSGSCSVWAS